MLHFARVRAHRASDSSQPAPARPSSEAAPEDPPHPPEPAGAMGRAARFRQAPKRASEAPLRARPASVISGSEKSGIPPSLPARPAARSAPDRRGCSGSAPAPEIAARARRAAAGFRAPAPGRAAGRHTGGDCRSPSWHPKLRATRLAESAETRLNMRCIDESSSLSVQSLDPRDPQPRLALRPTPCALSDQRQRGEAD